MSFFKRSSAKKSEPEPSSSKRATSSISKPAGPSIELIGTVYDSLRTEEDDAITIDGIEALGEQLGIDVGADIAILAFAWKCECSKGCRFTREEFTRGMVALGCESIAALKAKLPSLRAEIQSNDEAFKPFYRTAFKLSCEASQKTLAPETAVALLGIVYPNLDAVPHMRAFTQFLTVKEGLKRITQDEWNQLLSFSRNVNPDLSNYDDSAAWPLLMDDFVEWRRKAK